MNTAKQELLEKAHPANLPEFVYQSRMAGESWRSIAESVTADTGYQVSHETLRAWYGGARVA